MNHSKRIAYLVSEYPAVSHTFILREVLELRALNWDIRVASINPSSRSVDELANVEREKDNREPSLGISFVVFPHFWERTQGPAPRP